MAHILLIDDDDTFRRMLRRTLERAGHSVIEAENGAQGLQGLHDNTVDLVITDLIMPEMEGIETIRALRHDHPHLGIIAMSGGGRMTPESYLAAAKGLGATRVLAKPFENEELFAAIEGALQ